MGRERPLSDKIKQASFELEAFVGEPRSWHKLPDKDGHPIRVPEDFSPFFLNG